MPGNIFEVRIVNVNRMPTRVREEVIKKVADKPESFKQKFKGYAKVTYVTASPQRIDSVEPIEGTIIDHFKTIEGVNDFAVF